MTGKGILEALSFVDEKYIEEAETGTLREKRPMIRALLPLAACLCVALLALYPRGATEGIAQDNKLAGAVMQEAAGETVSSQEEMDIALDGAETPYANEVPSIILRITGWTENGFTATVEGYQDSELLPLGEAVQVEFLPNACIEVYEGDLVTVTRAIPREVDFPAGTLVKVRYVSVSEDGTIRAEAISLAKDD